MKQFEFESEFKRITQEFGTEKYSADRLKLIFESVEHLSVKQFHCIVNDMIADSRYAPMRKDFVSAANGFQQVRARDEDLERMKRTMPECAKCGNVGTIPARNKHSTYTCVFKCPCSFGQRLSKSIRLFQPSDEAEWELVEHHTGNIVSAPQFDNKPNPSFSETAAAISKQTGGKISIHTMPGYEPMSPGERERLVAQSKRRAEEFDQLEFEHD